MDPMLWAWGAAALSGAIVGLFLAVFGGGGSVLAAPLLLYFVGIADPHVAIGTSAAGVALNAMTGLTGHARAGRVKWPCAALFAATGVLGALAGSTLAKQVDGQSLLLFFALAMVLIALSMLRKPRNEGDATVRLDRRLILRLAPIGLGAGFAAGFFGIGGGFLIVPGLMAATGMTLMHAQASSLLSVAVFGASTSANYAVSGLVDWPTVLAMVVGGAAGTAAGLPVARRLGERAALGRRLFAGLIILVAIYVAIRALTG
ncbi:sulfite exporter TauE/SafE family protein [Brevundimonas sp.]|uniref:sulfite exporter TauE/SafE family protein n=1 Tax=Brevundimonas sp. TaxID=1871086 RepID=UPI002B9FF56E|nr:sulfite exporter TauE/SafE family protein [Brevundimonas sp.]HWQ88113.1 sulfite exporter TauE/SafE family protein [Brevundimonas sp.]